MTGRTLEGFKRYIRADFIRLLRDWPWVVLAALFLISFYRDVPTFSFIICGISYPFVAALTSGVEYLFRGEK